MGFKTSIKNNIIDVMTLAKTTAEHSQRLDRIENKIDRLSETVVAMARVEEKILTLENDKKFLMEKIIVIDSNLRNVEIRTDETAANLSLMTKIFWIAFSAVTTTVVAMYLRK